MANLRLLSLNEVKIVGRLTRDPELRYTTTGIPVCRMRVAVGRRYKERNSGEWREEVAYVSCTVWRETAERCGQRLKKGSPVYVEGRLKSRDWETKDGQKRSDLEVDIGRIQFLESLGRDGAGEEAASETTDENGGQSAALVGAGIDSGSGKEEEEVPF